MNSVRIGAIVEGHGECEAVPVLIRRIAGRVDASIVPELLSPFRVPLTKLRKDGELERYTAFVAAKLQRVGGIVVLADCDWADGCPAVDGPILQKRAVSACGDLPITVVLARYEFEAWFLAAAESLRGHRGLPDDLEPPAYPERIRGAKEWLSDRMPEGRSYSEAIDQPALAAVFDIDTARRADSFDKFYRDVEKMLNRLRS